MKYVIIPQHYFSREWECRVHKPNEIGCTPETRHSECSYTYKTSMTQAVYERMKAYSDASPVDFWRDSGT